MAHTKPKPISSPLPGRPMDDQQCVLALMHAAEKIDRGHWLMKCPAHRGDGGATLEVHLEAGRYALHCIGGCKPDAVIRAAIESVHSKGDRLEIALAEAQI